MLTVFVRSFLVVGRNDGSVRGVRYFTCEDKHGRFVRPNTCTCMVWIAVDWSGTSQTDYMLHILKTLLNHDCRIELVLFWHYSCIPQIMLRAQIPISSSANLVSFCTICWTREQQLEIIHEPTSDRIIFITCHTLKLGPLRPVCCFLQGMCYGTQEFLVATVNASGLLTRVR